MFRHTKYDDEDYVIRYAALWAYGYESGYGGAEGLYRAVLELAVTALDRNGAHKILDVGCGVGRTTRDLGMAFREAAILGLDSSGAMIRMAMRVTQSEEMLSVDMRYAGLGILNVPGRCVPNVSFREESFPEWCKGVPDSSYDLITAVNVLDRLEDVRSALRGMAALLRHGGVCIVSTPLNWWRGSQWDEYGSFADLMREVKATPEMKVDVAFDGLVYREVLDARGGAEVYETVLMRLVKGE